MATENIVGNHYDKYQTKNPIARLLMRRFLDTVTSLYNDDPPASVLEVGCGEGRLIHHLVTHARRRPERVTACDLELGQIAHGLDPAIEFKAASVYELPYADAEFELIVCCEVLEHLEEPARAVAELARVAQKGVLISTPRDRIWRVMNMARGKYLRDLGNTPGHIQHFERDDLTQLIARRFTVQQVRTPLPWVILRASSLPSAQAH